jgi:2-polyprenyl-3-methyl-5-hydroxy-6-metoxy-1,4-benzoquinol methylase
MSNEFVFKKLKDGSLEYVGDFNSVYQNQIDPWSQSADSDDGYKLYYQHSRSKIKNAIAETDAKNVLEVGCGIGYVCDFLIKNLNLKVVGMDISSEAIKIAKKTFP